ncbi:MAG: ester cyclase [Rubrobacter sp.]|jgi:predicted ester cyclase|nr:ester cyclase [Rubrobacter sp.]
MVEHEPSDGQSIVGTTLSRSSRIAVWGGLLVASGGFMFVVAAFVSFGWMVGWISPTSPGYEMFAEEYAVKRLRNMFLALTAPLGALLVAAGLPGVFPLLEMRSNGRISMAKAGVYLALASSLCAAALTVYESMPRYFERNPAEFLASQSAYAASFLGWMIGVALVGFAAFRARSLGAWKSSLTPLAFLCLPARHAALLLMYATGFLPFTAPGFAFAALIEVPRAVGGIGWILFGLALSKAWEKELETTRKENLALVRRFYEEAWGRGRAELVDDILAPDFVDHRRGAEGAETFKNYLADLRATFPDLTLDIHSQTAEKDEVETRCELHGTDRGGVLYYPPTHKHVAFTAVFTDTMRGGRITDHRGEIDEAALFEQLGHENRESGAAR